MCCPGKLGEGACRCMWHRERDREKREMEREIAEGEESERDSLTAVP